MRSVETWADADAALRAMASGISRADFGRCDLVLLEFSVVVVRDSTVDSDRGAGARNRSRIAFCFLSLWELPRLAGIYHRGRGDTTPFSGKFIEDPMFAILDM